MSDDTLTATLAAGDRPWVAHAACRGADPNLFFPERGAPVGPAKAICRACPVRVECLTWALDNNETEGIWGGSSGKDRRRRDRRAVLLLEVAS